ncbi:sensor histidine kinase [Furfurilactobacillus siliginis]|uniref:histidine kinase n=1 Tax=Furfurilactobacillus siliginis TaxID=348151 RepID=A0A0R2L1R7_9LACO|nr:HAMP domain-containing sensor histidine kinase [Furfurilactobacillus siliginis]KRN95743.1 Signal transduction histidine kinase [Furfurilactobacillus siliginis]GEK27995.1 signal transduction histidine kinase [Furfurilactobacillus siliginis]
MDTKNHSKQPQHAFAKQQWWLFVGELVSFAAIFLTMALILWRVFQPAIYQSVNQGIRVQRQVILGKQPTGGPASQDAYCSIAFRTSILVYNDHGQLLNGNVNRPVNNQTSGTNADQSKYIKTLQQIKLRKTSLNMLRDVRVNNQNSFRTLTFYVPESNPNLAYAGYYVMIVTNTDSERVSVQIFKRVLTWTMLFFWLVSIVLSYVLARLNMRPIMRSWRRQREFVANAAHELRTPLTIIQNKLELMLTHPNDKIVDQTEQITMSLGEVRRLNGLTSDLLLLARSDSDMTQINTEAVAMKPFLENVIQPYSEIAASQDKHFDSTIDLTQTLSIDRQRIHQLIVIFLDNALKYTTTGNDISFTAKQVGNRWILRVADTGIGLSDADKPHVFERFYRVDKSRSRQTGGNGLGLSIAKWIIDSHKGRVAITDNTPTGTIFTISFPMTKAK